MAYRDFYLKDIDLNDEKLQLLTPWERFLLTRRPIIAPDGYIPNSVVRKRIRFVQPESPKPTWQLKPVPDFDPRYLPDGWHMKKQKQNGSKNIETITNGNETDKLSMKESFRPRNSMVVVPMKNVSKDDSNKAKFDYHTGSRKVNRVDFNLNGSPEEQEAQKTLHVNESEINQLPSMDENAGNTLNENAKSTDADKTQHTHLDAHHSKSKKSPAREKRNKVRENKKKTKARENAEPIDMRIAHEQNQQEQTIGIDNDTDKLVNKDEIIAKDEGAEVLEQLLREDWFPLRGQHGLGAILEEILKLLELNNNDIFCAVCQYLVRIFQLFTISPELDTRAKEKLHAQLKNPSIAIVDKSKWALQQLESIPDTKLSEKVTDGTNIENKQNETMIESNQKESAPTAFLSDANESQLQTSDRSKSPAKSSHSAKAKRKKHKRERSSSSKKINQVQGGTSSETPNAPAGQENTERMKPINKEDTDINKDNSSKHNLIDNDEKSSSKQNLIENDKNSISSHYKIDNYLESSSKNLSIDNAKDSSSKHRPLDTDKNNATKHLSDDNARTFMKQGQIGLKQEEGITDAFANSRDRQPSDAGREKGDNLTTEEGVIVLPVVSQSEEHFADDAGADNSEDAINVGLKLLGKVEIEAQTSAVRKLSVNIHDKIGGGAIGGSYSSLFDGIGDLSSSESDTDSSEHNQIIVDNSFGGNNLDAHNLEGNDLKDNHFEGNDHEGNTLLLNDSISQAAIVGSHTVIDFNAQSLSSISSKSSQKSAPAAIDEEIQFSNQREKVQNADVHLEIKRNTSFPSVSNVNPVQYTVIGGPAPQYNHLKKKKATTALDTTKVNDDHSKGLDDVYTTSQSHMWSMHQQQKDQACVPFSSGQNFYEVHHLPGGLVSPDITLPALPGQDTSMKKELLLAFCNGLPDIGQHRRTLNLSPFHISDGELDRSFTRHTTSTQIASCHKGHAHCEHMRCAQKKMHHYISISKFLSNVSLSQRMSDLTSRPKLKEKTTFGQCRYTAVWESLN